MSVIDCNLSSVSRQAVALSKTGVGVRAWSARAASRSDASRRLQLRLPVRLALWLMVLVSGLALTGSGGRSSLVTVASGLLCSSAHASDRRKPLEETLRTDKDPAIRRQAAIELGKLADPEAMTPLIQFLLRDRSAEVRAACAQALGELGEAGAKPALRAAQKDESPRVQKQATAALKRLEQKKDVEVPSGPMPHVAIVLGRMGSKAKSGTMENIPKHLHEAVLKELRSIPEFDVGEDLKKPPPPGPNGKVFSVDGSVTNLNRRTTSSGELEISCDVSIVIAMVPGKNIVGMVSGGASSFGPRGPSTKPTKALLENLELQALTQAVQAANENLVSFLRSQAQKPR